MRSLISMHKKEDSLLNHRSVYVYVQYVYVCVCECVYVCVSVSMCLCVSMATVSDCMSVYTREVLLSACLFTTDFGFDIVVRLPWTAAIYLVLLVGGQTQDEENLPVIQGLFLTNKSTITSVISVLSMVHSKCLCCLLHRVNPHHQSALPPARFHTDTLPSIPYHFQI